MLAFLAVLCGLLGLAVGSFLNVVIYRVPRKMSIVRPRSACPRCGTQISDRDNVPVVSWLVLRGKCRTCGEPISVRYPIVEATTGVLFFTLALRFGYSAALPAYLVLVAGLFALACIDLDMRLLPRSIVYPLLGIVAVLLLIASAATGHWRAMAVAALCSVGWFVVFWLINFASPRMLGYGDVRLALVLGLGLGWLGVWIAVIGFFLAAFVGAVVGGALIAVHKAGRESQIPFGVFLAIGAAIAIYAAPLIHIRLRGG